MAGEESAAERLKSLLRAAYGGGYDLTGLLKSKRSSSLEDWLRKNEATGRVEVVDIGLDVSGARMWMIEDADVVRFLSPRPRDAHKWTSALAVVAGSPGMTGAAGLPPFDRAARTSSAARKTTSIIRCTLRRRHFCMGFWSLKIN